MNNVVDILKDKKKIRQQGLIIIDNEKIFKDLLNYGLKPKYFLYSSDNDIIKKYSIKKDIIIKVKNSIINKFSDVEKNRGFVAVFEAPQENKLFAIKESKLILFDTIQDPANAGAIIRSGAAFGFDSYLFLNTVYIFNDKTIRSSAGACFMVKYTDVVLNDIIKLKQNNYKIIITDTEKGKDIKDIKKYLTNRFILVFGNEGAGITEEVRKIADESVKIDYPNRKVESLNVSNAASILFYELSRKNV